LKIGGLLILLAKWLQAIFRVGRGFSHDQAICVGMSSCKRLFFSVSHQRQSPQQAGASASKLTVQVSRRLFKNLVETQNFFSKDWQGSTQDRIDRSGAGPPACSKAAIQSVSLSSGG